jgi:DNA polymerase-3 subunit epsilon
VHGITDEFLEDKPKYIDVHKDFVEFIRGSEVIAHNASFDIGFIEQEWAYLGFDKKVADLCQVTDTLALARKKYPGQKNNLDILCKRLGVDLSKRVAHGALLDAELLSSVYLLMTSSQKEIHLQSKSAAIYQGDVNKIFEFKIDEEDLKEHFRLEKLMAG